jgi:cytochrome c peroxidase
MLTFARTTAAIAAVLLCGWTVTAPKPLPLRYPAYYGNRIDVPEDNPTTEEGVALGRRLFYETALSANGKISCGNCHRQELAFTDGQTFSTGFDGTPTDRNAMSLVNLLWVRNFFWDGRARGLEQQAETPLTHPHEMGQGLCISAEKLQKKGNYPRLFKAAFGTSIISGDLICKALAQFERTLISADSRYDRYLQNAYTPTSAERRGIGLFFDRANCGHCHSGPKTFNELFHNNGLDSFSKDPGRETVTGQVIDRGRFRVVTLRNIALTAPYMHDGRFRTLEAVLDHYSEHIQHSATLSPFITEGGLHLSVQEKNDIIAFLNMLTDSSFVTDKRFSNPFIPGS